MWIIKSGKESHEMTQLNKIRTQRFVVSGEVSQRLTVTRQTVDF